MASEAHSQPLDLVATGPLSSFFSSSTNSPEQMAVGWAEESSMPSTGTRGNACWELPAFTMTSHLEGLRTQLRISSSGVQSNEYPVPVEYDAFALTSLGGTPSLSDSFSSAEPDSLPIRQKKINIKNTRAVSNLTPEQLQRKRSNDRRAQRAIRERTKQRIDEYQGVLEQKDKVIIALSRRVRALEEELARHTGLQHGGSEDGSRVDKRPVDALDAGNPHMRRSRLASNLSYSQRDSLAFETASLPLILSTSPHNRGNPVAVGTMAGDAAGSLQDFNKRPLKGAPWPDALPI